jgi:hypothetical protein
MIDRQRGIGNSPAPKGRDDGWDHDGHIPSLSIGVEDWRLIGVQH